MKSPFDRPNIQNELIRLFTNEGLGLSKDSESCWTECFEEIPFLDHDAINTIIRGLQELGFTSTSGEALVADGVSGPVLNNVLDQIHTYFA